MGDTVDEALLNAEDAHRDYAVETERDGDELARPSPYQTIETPIGNQLVSIPPVRTSGHRTKV